MATMGKEDLKGFTNRDVRDVVEQAMDMGWTCELSSKGTKLFSPNGRDVVPAHKTCGSWRAAANLRAKIMRLTPEHLRPGKAKGKTDKEVGDMDVSAIAIVKPRIGEAPADARGVKCQVRLSVHADGTMRIVLTDETARRLGISAGTLAAVAEIDGNIIVDGTAGSGHAWHAAAGIGVMIAVPAADVADMGIVGPQAVGVVTAEYADGTLAFELPDAYYGAESGIAKQVPASEPRLDEAVALACTVGVAVSQNGVMIIALTAAGAKEVGIRAGHGADLAIDGRRATVTRHRETVGKHWHIDSNRLTLTVSAKSCMSLGITPGHRMQKIPGRVVGDVLSFDFPPEFFSVREQPGEQPLSKSRKAASSDPLVEIKAALEMLNEAIATSPGAVTVWQDGGKVRARVLTEVEL